MASNTFNLTKYAIEPLWGTYYNESIYFMFHGRINEIRNFCDPLKSDLILAVLTVLKKACAIWHFPNNILHDKTICRLAAKSDGRSIRFFLTPPLDSAIAIAAIESDPRCINDIPPALRWQTRILKKYINVQKLCTAAAEAASNNGTAAANNTSLTTFENDSIIPRHRYESRKDACAALYNYFAN